MKRFIAEKICVYEISKEAIEHEIIIGADCLSKTTRSKDKSKEKEQQAFFKTVI